MAKRTRKKSAPLAPDQLQPLLLTTPFELGQIGVGGMVMHQGRLYLAGRDKIFSADPTARGWLLVHDIEREKLVPELADAAEALGLVEDGAAAAAMDTELPGAFGLGPFCEFTPKGAEAPSLYLGSRALAGGEILVASEIGEDGATFTPVSTRGMGDPARQALTNLAVAKDWLITAPAPVKTRDRKRGSLNADGPVRIYGSRTPAPDAWTEVAEPGFGQDVTGGITALGYAHGLAYAAVEDEARGFSLWRAKPLVKTPWTWEKVIDQGAFRYSLAPMVTRMVEFKRALYLAVGISDTGFGKDLAGPAAAELLKIDAKGVWEVITGVPRFSPQGLKVPFSGMGPAFGDGWATLILSLAEHQGVLYVGTRHVAAEYQLYLADAEAEPAPLDGGCALWASTDGFDWQAVMTKGGGNPALSAIRALVPDPAGLYALTTANAALVSHDMGMEPVPGADDEVQVWLGTA